MNLKMRKFLKSILKVKYLILLLSIILVIVVVGLYFKKDLVANKVTLDNMEFSSEGFDNFLGKEEPVYSTSSKTWFIGEKDLGIKESDAKYFEKNGNWWFEWTEEDEDDQEIVVQKDTGIKATMYSNKVVTENDKYIMFIDELTTIVTIAEKDSLIPGGDAKLASDYTIKFSSAISNGNAASKGNFALTYASTNIAKPENKELNVYSQSISYKNVLTGLSERHYGIKYLNEENAVQIYYTIGNFGSIDSYFPEKFYATIYEPARCLYDSEAEYKKAVAEYKSDYLEVVGSLDNTFEERFRGNTQIKMNTKRNDATKTATVTPGTTIVIYNQEARDYIIDKVLPEMALDGIDVTINVDRNTSYDISNEAERDEYKLYLDDKARTAYEESKSEAKYPSVKWEITVPAELVNIKGEYYKKYFNNADSPLTSNPFMTYWDYNSLSTNYYSLTNADGNTIFYDIYTRNVSAGTSAQELYNRLYSSEQKIEKVPVGRVTYDYAYYLVIDGEEYPYSSSGYVAKDSEGNYIYDENGFVTQQLYNAEQVDTDNSFFGVETEGLPVFKVALEFKLTDEGYKISVPNNSLVDSTNVDDKLAEDDYYYKKIDGIYQIVDLKICPFMTQEDNTQDGFIIVPDGSGAVINFNNGKTSTVSGVYYGQDNAYVDMIDKGDKTNLLLGMYAFVNTTAANPKGLISIIEKGGGQFTLNAGVNSTTNFAYLTAQVRSKESIRTGTASSSTAFDKFDKVLSPSDLVINYIIVGEDSLDYSSIAKIYQNYLIKRDGLTFNDNTNTLLNDLSFLGSFDKYALLFGIKYETTDTLTTFDQAQAIMEELINANVNNLSISYKGWTRENLEYQLGGSLKVSKQLGKTTSITKFYEYCVEKGATFYPELSISSAKGYDYTFGSLKYTARGVGNEEAVHYPYDLATGRQDKKLTGTYTISPLYYKNITENLIEEFNKLNIWSSKENGGFLLTDLGNQWSGNYRKDRQVYGGDAILYQQEALALLAEGSKIKIEAPCDYAFKYVDIATNIPVSSTMYTVYDETIPFYQLVVSGLFDYTTENINGLSNRSSAYYLAKALETGSNLSYLLSAEDPSILLETDYTQYYQAYYNNWKDVIISFTNQINELDIHNCYLTKHEIVKVDNNSLSKVTYTNKTNPSQEVVLYVNVSNKTLNYNGNVIPAYGFIKG